MFSRHLIHVLSLLVIVALVAIGCSSQPAAQTPAPAPAPAAKAPEVDKAKIASEEANAALKGVAANIKTTVMAADEVKKMMEGKEANYYIVDIRPQEDFDKGHIKGAVNLPYGQLVDKMSTLPKDKTLVLYCFTGQQAGTTIVPLKLAGYSKVISISKGYNEEGFTKAGFQIEKK